jgi:hypothetical protein
MKIKLKIENRGKIREKLEKLLNEAPDAAILNFHPKNIVNHRSQPSPVFRFLVSMFLL